jgi:hypothetical protein
MTLLAAAVMTEHYMAPLTAQHRQLQTFLLLQKKQQVQQQQQQDFARVPRH